jgi:hypothetical protein
MDWPRAKMIMLIGSQPFMRPTLLAKSWGKTSRKQTNTSNQNNHQKTKTSFVVIAAGYLPNPLFPIVGI